VLWERRLSVFGLFDCGLLVCAELCTKLCTELCAERNVWVTSGLF